MKIQVDGKFLATSFITMVLLVVVVIGVNAFAGLPAATVAAAVIGAVAVKLFDKVEYHPSGEVAFGSPLVSVSWIYAAVASILMLSGTDLGWHVLFSFVDKSSAANFCRTSVLVPAIFLDWGGFILGGWLIGRLFPKRALGLSSLAGFVVVIVALLDSRHPDIDAYRRIAECFGFPLGAAEEVAGNESSFRIGMLLGVVARAYLAIVTARVASRRPSTPLHA
jgi:hypothetical protein